MVKVYAQALQRAAELLGGKEPLAELLKVPVGKLEAWISRDEVPPMGVFLSAVDLISEASTGNLVPGGTVGLGSGHARQRALDTVTAVLLPKAEGLRRPCSVMGFLHAAFLPCDGREMVESALDAAVAGTGADMGNLQISRPDGLVIVAQRGFEAPFLKFFACVDTAGSCGAALRVAERVVVEDVQSNPIFVGTDSAEIMEQAQARACQSTPLIGASGEVLGMLSTHYAKPRRPTPQELDVLDHIAKRTAYWLDGGSP